MTGLTQVVHLLNNILSGPRLTLLKNIVFVLVLLHYWSRFYNKVVVGGPARAIKDFQMYFKRVKLMDYIGGKNEFASHWYICAI